MADLIDRQKALEGLYDVFFDDELSAAYPKEADKVLDVIRKFPSAQPEPHWIPCSERLPEESGRYLVSVLDGVGRRTTVAPYQPRYKAWTMTGRMAYWKVIAWMPLPEPYRAERRADEKKDI